MKNTDENLTAHQSLDIITSMIREAKGNVRSNGFYFLLWGWIVVIANLGMFILARVDYAYPYAVWAITIPAWIFSMYRGFTHGQRERSMTHLGTITVWLWAAFGVCIFTLIAFGYKINYQINPVILVISAMPTFISGITIKFRPLCYGGAILWLGGIANFIVDSEYQPLVGAAAIALGYLLPGYLLKYKND